MRILSRKGFRGSAGVEGHAGGGLPEELTVCGLAMTTPHKAHHSGMRHARDADARRHPDFSFYINDLTGMMPGGDLTDPDAATAPKWHTARHLSGKKGIIAADPIWDVPFHACANSGGVY